MKKKKPLIFGRWNRLKHPCDPKLEKRKEMDGGIVGKKKRFLHFIYLVRTYKIAE